MDDNLAKSLSYSLSQLKYLIFLELDLQNMNISKEGAESLSSSLRKLKNLNSLKLNFCIFGHLKKHESISSALNKL